MEGMVFLSYFYHSQTVKRFFGGDLSCILEGVVFIQ